MRSLVVGVTVELQQIVERYAESLEHVDATTRVLGVNRRTKATYQPGVPSMTESLVVPLLDDAWEQLHPGERHLRQTEVPHPSAEVSTKLDHVMTTDGLLNEPAEWGIEVKRLQFVGDNGKNGDHETAKMLSPYLKDRGVLHDALRIRDYGFTRRVAVIGYGFDYDKSSLAHAATLHTSATATETINNIRSLVRLNGPLHYRPLIEFADAILRMRGWTKGPRAEAAFQAWRHPSGGAGVVFGWEIRRPHLEPDYDPRHPW